MKPHRRNRGPQAVHLTAAERKAVDRREELRRKRRLVRVGQVLMAVGALVVLVHLLAHLQLFGDQPSGTVDLLAGYPAGALLFLVGAILAGQ